MTTSDNKVNSLLNLVRRPQQAKRKPSNFALYWAWLFYNSVALLFDVIAATTVYGLVGKFVYAILTFAAGFAPLLMHEFLYTRAYANTMQKILAVIGSAVSVVTILTVGLIAGIINVVGFTALSSKALEITLIVILVAVSGLHALIAAVYFYIDDGIKANQVRAESMAYHERRLEDINRAKEILASAEIGRTEEDKIAETYGDSGREILNEILGQLRGDVITVENTSAPQQSAPTVTHPQPTAPVPTPTFTPVLIYSLQDFLAYSGKSKNEARILLAEYGLDTPQKAFGKLKEYGFLPPQMTAENFAVLYTELQSEAAELQPIPFPTGMGSNGNGHK